VLRLERLAVRFPGDEGVVVLQRFERAFDVNPCSACATTNRAVDFGRTSSASSRQCAPLKLVSKRLQRVTQWMSIVTSVCGSAWSSAYVSVTGSSTSPKTLKSHAARSVFGTLPAWRTGHFSVRYWPGGRRPGSSPLSTSFFSARDRKNDTRT
jgi:hypothetical protein